MCTKRDRLSIVRYDGSRGGSQILIMSDLRWALTFLGLWQLTDIVLVRNLLILNTRKSTSARANRILALPF